MKTRALFLSLLFAMSAQAGQGSAGDILKAIGEAKVESRGDLQFLYGTPVNGDDTVGGRFACARVVSVILNAAGARVNPRTTAVRDVEVQLASWKKIEKYADVQAGDVVIYKMKSNRSGVCTGGGACHVVIAVSKQRVYGNVGRDIPPFVSKGPAYHLMAWFRLVNYEFKSAYRPN